MGSIERSFYDPAGNLLREVDPEGRQTVHAYDGLGRRTQTTRPGGIAVTLGYDLSGRRTSYRDALGNTTAWSYDPAGRPTGITYPDGATESYGYDGAGNLTLRVDGRGWTSALAYDDAGRLTGRTATPPAGAPLSEVYAWDGLGRLTTATSASGVVTSRSWDSLSRLVSEVTTLGGQSKAVAYGYDVGDAVTSILYPSGREVIHSPDVLGRPGSIAWPGAQSGDPEQPKALYGFRGVNLVAEKALGAGGSLAGTFAHDGARRLTEATYALPGGGTAFSESVRWSPRNLKERRWRGDLNGLGQGFSYDPAGRLLEASRQSSRDPNNPAAGSLATLPERFGFTYDSAENLLSQSQERLCAADQVDLPLDASGRNRPAAIGETLLAWDADGNLTQKGALDLHYDHRDRLLQVTTGPGATEVASYAYDVFGRRVAKTVGGVTSRTVWSGWQALEEYAGAALQSRNTYGLGLDEAVALELDPDGDGTFAEYLPLYDSTGNLALLTDTAGKPVERYEYSPYGERWILVDSTPPEVEQIRKKGDELWIELSEEVLFEKVEAAVAGGTLTLQNLTQVQPIAFEISQPVSEGRNAGRRLVLKAKEPVATSHWPAAEELVELTILDGVLEDFFANQAAPRPPTTLAWPAALPDATIPDQVFEDTTPPEILEVCLKADNKLELTFSEEPSEASLSTVITIDGAAVAWTLSPDRYTLLADTALADGEHTLAVTTDPLDLNALGLAAAFTETFTAAAGTQQQVFTKPHPGLAASSTVGNQLGFHGLSLDEETGLLYVRNRYYDPNMGRFVTTDPLGYVDGPSTYAFAGNNPSNFGDPLGLNKGTPEQVRAVRRHLAAIEARRVLARYQEYEDYLGSVSAGTDRERRLALLGYVQAQGYVSGQTNALGLVNSFLGPADCDLSQSLICSFRGTGRHARAMEFVVANATLGAFGELAALEVSIAGPSYGTLLDDALAEGRALGKLRASASASGLPSSANFAQKTFGSTFSPEGQEILSGIAGQPISTVDDLAAAIRSGTLNPADIPVNVIVRDSTTLILNTRTVQALERAGVSRSSFNVINKTGDPLFEHLLSRQLRRNKLTSKGVSTVRPSRN